MTIRNATYHDAPAIKLLLEVLGHTTRMSPLVNQLETIFGKGDHQVFVYELRKEVIGFITVSFIPQLGIESEMARINYLATDEAMKGHGIEKNLEEYAAKEARMRKCDRIEIAVFGDRVTDDSFYEQQGYQENAKYFYKALSL